MTIKTFYWAERNNMPVKAFYEQRLLKKQRSFRVGNAGDIYVRNLIKYIYGEDASNNLEHNNRLLLIGSISHLVKEGDIVCGIGTKKDSFNSEDANRAEVWGLRGPISYEIYKKKGFDLSKLKFQLDPGLLIRYTVGKDAFNEEKNAVSFIPHYREIVGARRIIPNGIKIISIDDDPHKVARNILKSKLVYSSSLHGIIFCHALGVPVVFVRPQSNETLEKFKDYYLAMELEFPKPLDSIEHYKSNFGELSPASVNFKEEDFVFPSLEHLKHKDIFISGSR